MGHDWIGEHVECLHSIRCRSILRGLRGSMSILISHRHHRAFSDVMQCENKMYRYGTGNDIVRLHSYVQLEYRRLIF